MYEKYEVLTMDEYKFALVSTTIAKLAAETTNTPEVYIPQTKIEKGPVLGFVIDKTLPVTDKTLEERSISVDKTAWAIAHANNLDGAIVIISDVAEKLTPKDVGVLVSQKALYLKIILRDKQNRSRDKASKPRDRITRQIEADAILARQFGKDYMKDLLLRAMEANVEKIVEATSKFGIDTDKFELTKMLLNDHEFSERLIGLS